MLATSQGEGFGLPLIEAAQHKLPILARALPVFREVAGEHATFFEGDSAQSLADAINQWLQGYRDGSTIDSVNMPWLTWEQSAEQFKRALLAPMFPASSKQGGFAACAKTLNTTG